MSNMSTRITFNGGSLVLNEPTTFTGRDGELVNLEAAIVVQGVSNKPIRLPLDAAEAIVALGKNDAYKEFVKKYKN